MNFALFSAGISSAAASQISEIIGKPTGHITFAVITTAATPYIEKNFDLFPDWLNDDVADIKGHGFQTRFFRLEDVTPERIEAIRACDVIYFTGGNIYYLRYWIDKADFLDTIKYFANEKLYAGGSAGAILVTHDIGVYKNIDKPDVAPDFIPDGLKLVDAHILVHWNQLDLRKELEKVAAIYKKDNERNTFYLSDGQVLFLKFGEFQQI